MFKYHKYASRPEHVVGMHTAPQKTCACGVATLDVITAYEKATGQKIDFRIASDIADAINAAMWARSK